MGYNRDSALSGTKLSCTALYQENYFIFNFDHGIDLRQSPNLDIEEKSLGILRLPEIISLSWSQTPKSFSLNSW